MTLPIRQTVKEDNGKEVVRNRTPLGIPSLRLPLPVIKGYFCRWFNDEGGRIEQVLSAGYEFVESEEAPGFGSSSAGNVDLGSRISTIVGVSDTGSNPMRAFLMKLRQEWRDEDDKAKQKELDKTDAAIRSGAIGPSDNRYVKNISYENR